LAVTGSDSSFKLEAVFLYSLRMEVDAGLPLGVMDTLFCECPLCRGSRGLEESTLGQGKKKPRTQTRSMKARQLPSRNRRRPRDQQSGRVCLEADPTARATETKVASRGDRMGRRLIFGSYRIDAAQQ
jgi:hypothetical protein